MSLILEALKKAERMHKLGEVPGISADAAPAPAAGVRGLGWVMLTLFACIMLGLGIYLGGYRHPLTEGDGEPLPPPTARHEIPPTTPIAAEPAALPTQPALIKAPPKAVVKSQKPMPARPLSEMPSGFVANLPSMNVDIHSYDKIPAKRYVLINMEKYREGDYLDEGPLLVEIRPDGVVLEHFGERFIMPIGNQ